MVSCPPVDKERFEQEYHDAGRGGVADPNPGQPDDDTRGSGELGHDDQPIALPSDAPLVTLFVARAVGNVPHPPGALMANEWDDSLPGPMTLAFASRIE